MLLKTYEGKLFALSQNKIYTSSIRDYKNWKEVGSFNSRLDYAGNYPQLYGDSFYFKVYNQKYKRFNYKTLVVEEIDLSLIHI